MEYDKLVRDKIPFIIKKNGHQAIIRTADIHEYWVRLLEKLEEETEEFVHDEDIEELADILEVIDAICKFKGFSMEEILKIKKLKKKNSGGFDKKIVLLDVKE